MADPAKTEDQNILPVQALFNLDNSFNTFIGQGQPFIVSATESIGIQDVPALNATLYPTFSPVSTGQVTSLDVASTKLSFNPSTGTLSATTFQGSLSGTATATSNIANGVSGNVLYQTAPGVTSFVTNGSTGQVLTSNGSSAPTWSNPTAYATVTDDTTTNATRYPLFAAATSGNLTTEYTSSTRYQFNPSTGVLTATGFSGSGAGLTSIPNSALTNSSVTIGSTAVSLGATVTTFAGLTSVTSTTFVGALTGNASSATTATTATNATNIAITDDTTSVSSVYPTWVTTTTGNLSAKTSSTKFSFVPSTGVLSATSFNGAGTGLTGTASSLSIGGNAATVTNGVYTTDTGTVTNTMLAGSIANAKLTNSAITFGSTSQALGSTVSAISGVTIDNGAIGSTTPAAGKFTTLESTGTASLGTASAQYMQIAGDANYPALKAAGSGTNIPAVVQPKGTGALQAQQTDSTATGGNARGAYAVDWQTQRGSASRVASATNAFMGAGYDNAVSGGYSSVVGGYSNSATASQSAVLGGKSNISSGVSSVISGGVSNASAGYYNFIGGGYTNAGTANGAVTTQSGTMNGTTAVTLSGSNASIKVGQYITGTSIAAETYVAAVSGTSLTLSQAASGSSTSTLSFYTPHGVVVGGGNNQATGSYSFIGGGGDAGTASNRNVASGDWSFVGGGIKNTASGNASVIAGGGFDGVNGVGNTASGLISVVGGGVSNQATATGALISGGAYNTASGNYSTVVGGEVGTTRGIQGQFIFGLASGNYNRGNFQSGLLNLFTITTDATPTVLASTTSAAGTTNQVILPNNSAYYFKGTVVAGVTGGGNTKGWTVEGVIKRGANAASTTVVGVTVASMYADAGAVTWTIGATADTTNGGLAITFTGQAATTIRCVAKIETTEMTY